VTLASGTRLGPYEVLEPLGAGGMGEVYRARDTRLDRTVAVKVLPAHLTNDPALRQRLEREAKALSSLSHPNICSLFDIGQQDGVDFLVMEHLEGETLAQRLLKGPLPADELLRCALQIADALDKAHRRGVVHRDLKPGNIMLSKGGAKLLDFGLAKANGGAVAASEFSTSPTESRHLTAEGTLLGTFQYMAPEQLEGKEADVRTDIFALGAVLHEMATGKRAFSGTSQASLIGSIMHEHPPPISTLQPLTPPAFDRVVRACLAKDPEDRWQTAHDVVLELQWVQEGGSQAGLPAPVSARRRQRERISWAALALSLIAVIVLAFGFVRRAPRPAPIVRFQIAAPEGFTFIGSPSLSPNGRMIAFDGRDAASGDVRIWIRQLDALTPRALSGTEGATRPFWSPDSRFVAFVAGGKLKKVDVTGGPAQSLADTPNGSDGSWGREGVILLDGRGNDPILRIPAAGGAPRPEVKSDPSGDVVGVGWPQFLPDGRHFLYVVVGRGGTSKLMLRALDSEDSKLLLETPSRVQFVEPGYLLYVREDTLVAQRFDAARHALQGEAVPLSEGLGIDSVGLAHFTASEDGTLVYRAGQTRNRQLLWVDRGGKELDAVGDPAEWGDLWPSPDGRRLVVDLSERSTRPDLWIRDLIRGTTTRFTFDPASEIAPLWSPDGRRVVFSSNRSGVFNLYEKDAAGTGEERELLTSENLALVSDWSRDGRFLLFYSQDKDTDWDVWALEMQGERKAVPIVKTKFAELRPGLSPDARYMVYQSDESGRAEIYVVDFPTPSSKWQVSTSGGRQPYWSANGREIFYLTLDNALMAVGVEGGTTFTAGAPQRLFPARLQPATLRSQYRPSPDGQRFLTLAPLGRESIMPMTVVLNWTEALKH